MKEEILTKQYNDDIKGIMNEAMEPHTTSIQFESVWSIVQRERKKFEFRKIIAVPLIAAICLVSLSVAAFASYRAFRNTDKTDYSFVDDSRVKGKWESVDFVKNIEDFNPEKKSWGSNLYLTSLVFIKGGKMLASTYNGNLAYTHSTWTKGIVINKFEKTAEKYIIKDVNGTAYMFCQWKSGDYTFRNQEPWYYVLKKVDSEDYSSYQVKLVKEDKVDYPFIDDSEMKGKWESVDYLQSVDSFKPGEKSYQDDLYLTGLDISEKGKLTYNTVMGSYSASSLTWTKGLIINREIKTASKCEIKDIDGATYMFFEWKSGDYISSGMKPWYYVLKKIK